MAILLPLSLAADCDNGSCLDETSLLQIEKIVKLGNERGEAPEAYKKVGDKKVEDQLQVSSAILHSNFLRSLMEKSKQQSETQAAPAIAESKPIKKHANSKKPAAVQYVAVQVPTSQLSAQQQPVQLGSAGVIPRQQSYGYGASPAQSPGLMPAQGGYMTGVMPNTADFHYNTMTIQSQVSNGEGNDSPRRAAARAAEAEEAAERAMEEADWKAQQEERAAMYASKKAQAMRAAAEKASSAENAAARAQILAADAQENHAVRTAATQRTHARVAAYKSIVQQATSYQAAADQTFAAQRAAAAHSAMEAAQSGLHNMQDDTADSDNEFNDRDSSKRTRDSYHDAMDNIHDDRDRDDDDEDIEREMDEDEDFHGHHRKMVGNGYGGSSLYSSHSHGGRYGSSNCGDFHCPAPAVVHPKYRHKHCRGGCSAEQCCKMPNCRGFACPASAALLPNPDSLMCGIEGCTAQRCCSAAAGLAGGSSGSCKVGDVVDATFAQDGRQYRAKITALNADQTFTVNWLDGYTDGNVVAGNQVFVGGQPCIQSLA